VRPNRSQDLVGGLVQVDERDSELAGAAARLFAGTLFLWAVARQVEKGKVQVMKEILWRFAENDHSFTA
jgi:hypothetical protein